MTRVKRGSVARKHRKNILKITSGFQGAHSKSFRTANQQGVKASASAYLGRINRKREIRRLWIARINAAARRNEMIYSNMIHNLYKNQVYLNCKILAQIAILDTNCFSKVVQTIRI
uniref:ribosomal protein L20 n=1 Tax=Diplopterygium chinense TaxID=397680 RepID=UPI0020296428|nr:ribosomal protein L20 [Diplopterygium chinense]QYC92988.1 ribosomal protein L20 [Diplopterygium chinense]